MIKEIFYITEADGRIFCREEDAKKHEFEILDKYCGFFDRFCTRLEPDLTNLKCKFILIGPCLLDAFNKKYGTEFNKVGIWMWTGTEWYWLSPSEINTIQELHNYND